MRSEIVEDGDRKIVNVILDNGNSWRVKEIYSDGTSIIFPFKLTVGLGNFEPRYKNISSIKLGANIEITKGLYKNINYGLGFTSKSREIVAYIEKVFPKATQIKIDDYEGHCELAGDTVEFTLKAFNILIGSLYSLKDFHKKEIKDALEHEFFAYFGDPLKYPETIYPEDEIHHRLLPYDEFDNLSEKDIETINRIIPYFASKTKSDVLIKTKEAVDIIYIENVLEEFSELINSSPKTTKALDSLEKKWHEYFKTNSWLLAQLFYSPVTLIQDEAFVGGKGLNNKDGKLADFVYKNSFDSVSIIEIKTHLTTLMESKPYRGSDVFAASKDLSGGINQVLDQKHNFYISFASLKVTSDIAIEALNPTCILLIGQLNKLHKKQLKSFELYRNGMKDVIIVTFDELKKKIDTLLSILKNEIN